MSRPTCFVVLFAAAIAVSIAPATANAQRHESARNPSILYLRNVAPPSLIAARAHQNAVRSAAASVRPPSLGQQIRARLTLPTPARKLNATHARLTRARQARSDAAREVHLLRRSVHELDARIPVAEQLHAQAARVIERRSAQGGIGWADEREFYYSSEAVQRDQRDRREILDPNRADSLPAARERLTAARNEVRAVRREIQQLQGGRESASR